MQTPTVVAILIAIVIIFLVAISISPQEPVNPTPISTVGVNIYKDKNQTTLSHIEWGTLNPDDTANHTAFIHNMGNVNSMITVFTSDFNPSSLQQYITFTAPINNTSLQPDETVETWFNLHIHPNIVGINTFSFNINVIAT